MTSVGDSSRIALRSWGSALIFSALVLATASPACAQRGELGRGRPTFDWQTRGAYDFGFQPLFDVVLVNDSGQTMYFEAASFTSTVRQPRFPANAWRIPPGQVGRPEILARRIDAAFRTEDGLYVLIDPVFATIGGRNLAVCRVTAADIARADRPTGTEALRAKDFQLALRRNPTRGEARFGSRDADSEAEQPPIEYEQSIYRLLTDPLLTRDIRRWIHIVTPLD